MARLTEEEQALLKRLSDKQKAPDTPAVGRSITANIDLGDEAQVERAIRFGFLTREEVAEDAAAGGDDKEGGEDDDAPRRKGYFS